LTWHQSPDVVNQAERHLTVGVVNCCKLGVTLGTGCSQSSSVVLTTPKSNRRRASFFSQCDILVYFIMALSWTVKVDLITSLAACCVNQDSSRVATDL